MALKMGVREAKLTRDTHDKYLANARAAHESGNRKLAADFLSRAKGLAEKHNAYAPPGAGKVSANYDELGKRYGGGGEKPEKKPRGTVKVGARGGKYIETAGGQKYYLGTEGGKAVVRPA